MFAQKNKWAFEKRKNAESNFSKNTIVCDKTKFKNGTLKIEEEFGVFGVNIMFRVSRNWYLPLSALSCK